MAEIKELLHRRNDLSTFLVHLTRDKDGRSARDNLLSILRDGHLKAHGPMGLAASRAGRVPAFDELQKVVCFTETPLEQTWMMCEEISGRSIQLSPYGVAVTKKWARDRGANPVWYLDQTPGPSASHDWLSRSVNELIDVALQGCSIRQGTDGKFARLPAEDSQVARLAPYIETMGPTKDFAWEREWRRVGDLSFMRKDLVAVFAPALEQQALAAETPQYFGRYAAPLVFLDPIWGLETMIERLAGVET